MFNYLPCSFPFETRHVSETKNADPDKFLFAFVSESLAYALDSHESVPDANGSALDDNGSVPDEHGFVADADASVTDDNGFVSDACGFVLLAGRTVRMTEYSGTHLFPSGSLAYLTGAKVCVNELCGEEFWS